MLSLALGQGVALSVAVVSLSVLPFGVYEAIESGPLVSQLRACSPCHVFHSRHGVVLSRAAVWRVRGTRVWPARFSVNLVHTPFCARALDDPLPMQRQTYLNATNTNEGDLKLIVRSQMSLELYGKILFEKLCPRRCELECLMLRCVWYRSALSFLGHLVPTP